MTLPPSFSGLPDEEQHHYYRNVCLEFKKTIKSSKDVEQLQRQIDRFLNASKQVQWPPHEPSSIYRKDEVEKAVQKVANAFRRYIQELESDATRANPQDLLDTLSMVETMVGKLKVR